MKTVYTVEHPDETEPISSHTKKERAIASAKKNPGSYVIERLMVQSGQYKGSCYQHRIVFPAQSNWWSG